MILGSRIGLTWEALCFKWGHITDSTGTSASPKHKTLGIPLMMPQYGIIITGFSPWHASVNANPSAYYTG